MQERERPNPGKIIGLICAFGILILYAPLATLVIQSFRDNGSWSWVWYTRLFENGSILEAFVLSLGIATVSTVLSVTVSLAASMSLVRARWIGRGLFEILTYVPLMMPEIVMGLALLIWFVTLHLTLGVVSIILSHVAFSVSYVIATLSARLAELDPSLDDAARDLGASPLQIFRYVTFPLLKPAILSGGLMAFTLSFDDFLISFFVSGAGTDTLPLKIYSMIRFGVSPEVNALSTVLLAITLLLVMGFHQRGKIKNA
jgi:spermidine/putrescine transport system permease protein